MRHCPNSDGVSSSGGWEKVSPEVQRVAREVKKRTGAWNWATEGRHWENDVLPKPLASCKSCEIGRLYLDPNPPFLWLEISGIVHPLSENGLKGSKERVFEASFLHMTGPFLCSLANKPNCSQSGVLTCLHFSLSSFIHFSFPSISLLLHNIDAQTT